MNGMRTEWVVEPRVRLRWAYLLLPAVLEVLALVFTGLTIANSSSSWLDEMKI